MDYESIEKIFRDLSEFYFISKIDKKQYKLNKNKIKNILKDKNLDYFIIIEPKRFKDYNNEKECYIKYDNRDLYFGELSQQKREGKKEF